MPTQNASETMMGKQGQSETRQELNRGASPTIQQMLRNPTLERSRQLYEQQQYQSPQQYQQQQYRQQQQQRQQQQYHQHQQQNQQQQHQQPRQVSNPYRRSSLSSSIGSQSSPPLNSNEQSYPYNRNGQQQDNTDNDLSIRFGGLGIPGNDNQGNQYGSRHSSASAQHYQQTQSQTQAQAIAQQQQQQQQAASVQAQIQALAMHALNQKIVTAQTISASQGWTLDESIARLGGFSQDEIRLLQYRAAQQQAMQDQMQREQVVGAGVGDDRNIRMQQLQQQRELQQRGERSGEVGGWQREEGQQELASRVNMDGERQKEQYEMNLRMQDMQAQQLAQAQQQQLLAQVQAQIEAAQSPLQARQQLTGYVAPSSAIALAASGATTVNLNDPESNLDGSNYPDGTAAGSAYEQRLGMKQQIEANLRMRSGKAAFEVNYGLADNTKSSMEIAKREEMLRVRPAEVKYGAAQQAAAANSSARRAASQSPELVHPRSGIAAILARGRSSSPAPTGPSSRSSTPSRTDSPVGGQRVNLLTGSTGVKREAAPTWRSASGSIPPASTTTPATILSVHRATPSETNGLSSSKAFNGVFGNKINAAKPQQAAVIVAGPIVGDASTPESPSEQLSRVSSRPSSRAQVRSPPASQQIAQVSQVIGQYSIVTRQPKGPPGTSDELGDRNFASRCLPRSANSSSTFSGFMAQPEPVQSRSESLKGLSRSSSIKSSDKRSQYSAFRSSKLNDRV